jgi:glucosamine--fructose-6-phosphate aminotransferase (isomerizing)
MCGIFGLIDIKKGDDKDHLVTQKYLHDLFLLTEPRGRQATGVALQHDGEIHTYKRPQTASHVLKSADYHRFLKDYLLVECPTLSALGHCRLVTDGSEMQAHHNQPIALSNVVGVHNGVINNFYQIKDQEKLETNGISDSQVLFRYFEKYLKEGLDPQTILKKFHQNLRGAASLGILFSDYKEMLVSTNFGSLYYSLIKDHLFVFASEESILKEFQKKHHFHAPITKLEPGHAFTINTETLEQKFFNFEDKQEIDVTLKRVAKPYLIKERSPSPKNIKRCTRCILPEIYPFLTFDKNGVCSICQKYQKQTFKGIDALHRFLEPYRSKDGEVDCLVGLSGGRDSSYGLHLLKKELGMNPVGFSYDWLLTSRKARHNIAKMAGALDVEVIYRCGNYQRQAKNIRDNIYGFLKDPDLGMMTFVQAGDKEMYHFGRKIRQEKNLKLTVWCSGYQLEQREFFIGYCGIDKTLVNNPRLYDYGWFTKLQLAWYYGLKTIKNPLYWNRSIIDNAAAFWHCFVAKDDFLYLFNYYPWDEKEVERVLREEYDWEADTNYGANQWRMDDFHTSFINYVYYTVGGFSEFDDFRSNQVREGLISRDEALRLTEIDNNIRYESLLEFSQLVGINLEHVLKEIDAIPKLYRY